MTKENQMFNVQKESFEWGGRTLTLETGKIARQADGAVLATYGETVVLATAVGDKDTAKVARTIRRDEERMAGYLEKLIPQLTKAVATAEIPASQRATGRRRSSSSRRKTTTTRSRATTSTRTRSRSRSGSTRARARA